ncbi:MAG: thioredoxin [Firmicutes bacterium]|nr:thioredoxin [Bacillota bacterium]
MDLSSNVVVATEANFQEIIADEKPVLVDFWAAWCMPCRMVSPILDEIAQERPDSVTVAKLNVDENPTLASRYGVMSIPTIVRFQKGQEVARVVGAMPKAELVRRLGL